jgi:uncharacterized DUF497 family protein
VDEITFSFDDQKGHKNFQKHGITFEEAKGVFFDENALLINDPDHSQNEDRFLLLGMSRISRILVVCHCYREEDSNIRIFSARKANRRERNKYFHRSQK